MNPSSALNLGQRRGLSQVQAELARVVLAFRELEQAERAAHPCPVIAPQPSDELVRRRGEVQRLASLVNESAFTGMPGRSHSDLSEGGRAALLRALVAWPLLKRSVLPRGKAVDMFGTRPVWTLERYRADVDPDDDGAVSAIAEAKTRWGFGASEIEAAQELVQRDMADSARLHSVLLGLRDEFGLHGDQPDLKSKAWRLMKQLYPEVAVRAEDVDIVVAGPVLFICLPYDLDKWLGSDPESFTPEQETARTAFLRLLQAFPQSRYANFPAFGALTPERLDDELVRAVSERCGRAPDEVRRTLPRVITVVPTPELDKYIVHDAWGHSYQAGMLHFDDAYAEMAKYLRPLRELWESMLRELRAGRLDEARIRLAIDQLLVHRVGMAMSGVVGEMCADMTEYKIVRDFPEERHRFPSSSFFRLSPLKLDLAMSDVAAFLPQATKALVRVVTHADRRALERAELLGIGAEEHEAEMLLYMTAAEVRKLAAFELASEPMLRMEAGLAGGSEAANLALRLLLHVACIQAELGGMYDRWCGGCGGGRSGWRGRVGG